MSQEYSSCIRNYHRYHEHLSSPVGSFNNIFPHRSRDWLVALATLGSESFKLALNCCEDDVARFINRRTTLHYSKQTSMWEARVRWMTANRHVSALSTSHKPALHVCHHHWRLSCCSSNSQLTSYVTQVVRQTLAQLGEKKLKSQGHAKVAKVSEAVN